LTVLRRGVGVETEQRHEVQAEEVVDVVAEAGDAGGERRSGKGFRMMS